MDYVGKTAFITGGAMGIGFSLAKAFAAEGVQLMLADINQTALDHAVEQLTKSGAIVKGIVCDVTQRNSIKAAAAATVKRYGKVHFVINNAGVYSTGKVGDLSAEKWEWAVNINQMSVIHGCEIFVPLIRSHGEGGHIINTASLAGHVGYALHTPYNTTKFAVVGYSEALQPELEKENIKVSVLCPGFVNTNIADNQTNDPTIAERDKSGPSDELALVVSRGLSPDTVAQFTLEQIKKNAFYIFPNPGTRSEITERYEKIMAAYDETDASELIQADPGSVKQDVAEAALVK